MVGLVLCKHRIGVRLSVTPLRRSTNLLDMDRRPRSSSRLLSGYALTFLDTRRYLLLRLTGVSTRLSSGIGRVRSPSGARGNVIG